MISRDALTDDQARAAIESGEFGPDVIGAAPAVIVVLTQSWCPQWFVLSRSLAGLKDGPEGRDLAVFSYEYDRTPMYEPFMRFKEDSWRNWEVPYVRLYANGRFLADGNFMSAGRLMDKLRAAPAVPE